ncbi:hypothetical protein N3K63_11010 [Microbacterium sp. W1N]|uniref:hypothetical protein n=1 Tax=Microbacterium festucae TaxID=2977531 RepID=UPI0021BFCA16|nr:hypothetical protein [Microbacterium festucae]MCT9820813.1 hypothetical protein [Microbacterium festucae]
MTAKADRSAAGAVVVVAVVQVFVFVVTTAVYGWSTIFAGNACDPNCDWAGAERAGLTYFFVSLVMFLCTAVAVVYAWRTGKALTWVPMLASVGVLAGLLISLGLFRAAMG